MATSATSAMSAETKKETKKELREEEDQITKELFIDNIGIVEGILSLIDRIPTSLLIFLSRFRICQQIAFELLTVTNSAYALLFLARLLLCRDAIEYDCLFYCERVAFVFVALFYCFKLSFCWKIAAGLYVFTTFLFIKSIFQQDSSDHEDISDSDYDEDKCQLENEPPPKGEFEQNQESLKETDGKLCEDLQKINEIEHDNEGSDMSYELVSDQASDDEEKAKEEEEKAKSYKEEEEEEVPVLEDDRDDGKNNLLQILNEYKEQCAILEKEKNDLAVKLYAATESLNNYREHYHGIQKEYLDYKILSDEEKRDLVAKFEETVETLKHYQCIVHEHLVSNNNSAANVAAAAAADESSLQLQASLVSARASLYEYQTKYQNAVNESEANRQKWEQERNELNAKLSATSSWYQYYVLATYDYQLQHHNLLVERNDLSAKLHSANASAEFYKACLDDSDEECRKLKEENTNISAKLFAETSSAEHYHNLSHELEEKSKKLEDEKNELVTKLCAANAASALYRSYLHDVGS